MSYQWRMYDVVQVNYGQGWLDYATIKGEEDIFFSLRLVNERGGFNGHPTADFRIVRGMREEVVYPDGLR